MTIETENRAWHETIMLGMANASAKAVNTARQTNTKLAPWLDGKVVAMTVDEWEAYEKSRKQTQENIKHV